MTRATSAFTAALVLAACARTVEISPGETATPATMSTAAPCATPLETRPANGADQQPAFAGQTRACEAKSDVAFDVTVLARQLEKPWAVEPLPDGALLVTEKPGRMRIVPAAGGRPSAPIAGLPAVDARGQGGLLDVALSPTFATDRTIFWSFSEPRGTGNATSVARGML